MSETQGWQYQPQRPEDFAGIAGAIRSDGRRISDLGTRITPGSVTAGFNQATAAGFGLTPAKTAVASVEVVKPALFSRAIVTLSAQGHAMWSVKGSVGEPGYGASWAQLELEGFRYRPIGHVSSGVTKERHWEKISCIWRTRSRRS